MGRHSAYTARTDTKLDLAEIADALSILSQRLRMAADTTRPSTGDGTYQVLVSPEPGHSPSADRVHLGEKPI